MSAVNCVCEVLFLLQVVVPREQSAVICFLLIVTRASNCFDCEDADVSDVYQIKRDSQRLSLVTLMLIWETFYSFSFLQLNIKE